MSTHGFLAFAAGTPAKVAYCHSDAYPSGLGLDVLHWLRSVPLDDAADAARALRVVDPNSRPTPEDVKRLYRYYDAGVDTLDPETYERRTYATWYQVLRRSMGDPALILAAGVIEDMAGFAYRGNAHYGYVTDFDARVFEAYRGCQKTPNGLCCACGGPYRHNGPAADQESVR